MFGVRSIPFCVLFKGGQPVDGFVGALPEAEVRKFLDKHVPRADEAAAEEDALAAEELLAEGDTASALERLQAAVATDPANDTARYDYIRALLGAGDLEAARRAFEPVAGKVMLDARLAAVGLWLDGLRGARRPPARSTRCRRCWPRTSATSMPASNWRSATSPEAASREAMDELLEIVMRDKAWRDELARKTYVAILEVMSKAPAKAKAEAPERHARGRGQDGHRTRRSGGRRLPAQAEHGVVLKARPGPGATRVQSEAGPPRSRSSASR